MANAQMAFDHTAEVEPASSRSNFWSTYALATFVYLFAALATRPVFLSDTMYYLRTANPGAAEFWDFGHLLWRPFLWVLLRHFSGATPADQLLRDFHILDFLSTAAGLLATWVLIATIRLFTHRLVAALIPAILLSFSQVVLTYSKGGCAYIFGFLAFSLGFFSLAATAQREQITWLRTLTAGGCLASAVCLWLPYVFAVPGALFAPVLLFPDSRQRWRLTLRVAATCALLGLLAYGSVAIHLGIRNISGLLRWAQAASHGATISGATRVIFGLARCFIAVGDGVIFKRFLLHDPYNPVSAQQVIGITFWQILLFYTFLAWVLGGPVRFRKGRCALWQLIAAGLPVLGFAAAWQGSDLERYLPLFPSLMLSIGIGLSCMRVHSFKCGVVGLFVTALVVSNLAALSARSRERRREELMSTISSLNELLPPRSLVLLPPMNQLWRIYWDFPEAIPLSEHQLKLQWLVTLGSSDTPQWRARACSLISRRWGQNLPVVIESSLLQNNPKQDSSWVEGDDRRVRWREIRAFTSNLEIGDRLANTDFFWIQPTMRNVETVQNCQASFKQIAAEVP